MMAEVDGRHRSHALALNRHEVVMLLGEDAEIEPRQENHMTQCGRGGRDSRDRRKEETEKAQRGKERVSGRKRRALGLGEQGDWETGTRGVSGEEGGESKRKQIFKTRHFPNYNTRCRAALRGARVTLSIWAPGTWQR